MRETEFREWLRRRSYQGARLTAKGVNNRVRKLPRIERALSELGFAERDLDEVHANGHWADLVKAVSKVAADWKSNEAAARRMAPQASDPTRQLSNLVNVARQYGHFTDGRDPNYDADADGPEAEDIDEAALDALKGRFLSAYPDFETGGGFAGRSSYHSEEDDYKRALVEKSQQQVAIDPHDLTALGGALLTLVLDDEINLVGDYRRKNHLRAVLDRSGSRLQAWVGTLATSIEPPPIAAANFVKSAWPLIREGSEHSLPYADIRVLATLFQALTRPAQAIAVSYTRFHNLGVSLLDRSLFGNNPLTAAEYEDVLSLSAELFTCMKDWGWRPRDLWDVQGFIWVTCKEKLETHGERDADRIRQHVLENYIRTAQERQADSVEVLVRDVNEALGLNQAWPNICQALGGRKFREMTGLGPPERIGKDQSSATIFRFALTEANGRPFLLFDAAGAAFKPVRHGERDGRSVFKIKPPGASNKADEAIAVETIAEVARAMLVDRLPARVQSVSGGPVNYIGYGKQKLVRYELDQAIAQQIGIPPTGNVNVESSADVLQNGEPPMPHPTNVILYGPPGTGKTYATAEEAVKLCDSVVPADRGALMVRYRELVEARRIDFVTFHQSYSYEEFVEGLRPKQGSPEGDGASADNAGFSLAPEAGVFRRIAQRAAASKRSGGQYEIGDRRVFKLSIGEAANPEDDYLFEEAMADGHALLGYDDIDWSDARFEDRDAIIAACRDYDGEFPHAEQRAPTPQTGRVQCPMIFRNWIKRGDLVVVSKGNSKFRAIGEVTGDYEYAPRETGLYSHRRKVKWLWIDNAGAPVDDIYAKSFSMRSVYLLTRGDLNIPALEGYINSQLPGAGPAAPESYVLIIDEINRGNISKIFGELITLIEPDKRAGMSNAIEVRLPYSRDPFSVPANLHIVGTMNTADRSIALLDTALRRRFIFREIAPDPEKLLERVDGVRLREVLKTINDRVEYLVDREHRIGHAFFINCRNRTDVDAVMRDKVIPLLQEYFFEDWSRVAAVLGEQKGRGGGFLGCRKLKDPTGRDGEERESWSVLREFAADAYDRLIRKPTAQTVDTLIDDELDEAAQ